MKTKDSDSKPPAYDAVVGNYLAVPTSLPPNYISGTVSISKTGNGTYQLTPGSPAIPIFGAAAIPAFTFEYVPFSNLFVNGFSYKVPKQTSNTILLDSTYLTLYTGGANTINVTLTSSAAGTTWIYSGVKQ